MAGILWDSAPSILPLRVATGKDVATPQVIEAIQYAADVGCRVINLSLGFYGPRLAPPNIPVPTALLP